MSTPYYHHHPTPSRNAPSTASAPGLRSSISSIPRSPSSASVARVGKSPHEVSGSRKRVRTGGEERTAARSTASSSGLRQLTRPNAQFSPSASPPPLANTRYRLAGGLDTPTAAASSGSLTNSPLYGPASPDLDFRRRWTRSVSGDGRQTFSLGGLDRERNGRSRRDAYPMELQTESWTQYMFRLAGGFAGRVWDFCKPNTFQGFTSGGGAGYAMTDGAPYRLAERENRTPQPRYPILPKNDDDDMRSTPVPGEFPIDDYIQINEQPSEEDEQGRPNKRLQTAQGSDWVVVQQDPSRQLSDHNRAPSSTSPYRSSRVPRAVHTRTTPVRRPRPSTNLRASTGSTAASVAGTSASGRPRTASYAPPRSPRQPQLPHSPQEKTLKPSPSSVEIQRYNARKDRQERQNEASMRRLNSQLQAMIREGQQALATKIDVEQKDPFVDEPEDEGYSEGDYYDSMKI